jgi:acetyl-CoA carboxylase biotin carboxyl carrier protein
MAKKITSSTDPSAHFTDTKRVKDLIALMAENGLTEIELVEDKSRIVLRRGTVSGTSVAAHHQPTHFGPHTSAPAAHTTATPPPATPALNPDEGLIPIKSPMVGTFYSSPNPESDTFASIGTQVTKDKTVVCIIEAMKVFNEIHADATGTVVKVLVANGQAVEYGQPMFLVKPN